MEVHTNMYLIQNLKAVNLVKWQKFFVLFALKINIPSEYVDTQRIGDDG